MSEDEAIYNLVVGTIANDQKVNTRKSDSPKLTFKRDEKGILWSYDAKTGKKVGRIFEHGDDANKIDKIKEV